MKRHCEMLVALAAILCLISLGAASRTPSGPVKHFVSFMLENRAFDHMIGHLKIEGARINGLTGHEFNLWDPADGTSKKFFVNDQAQDISPDPGHKVNDVTTQIFSARPIPDGASPNMAGFLLNARQVWGDAQAPIVMECWNASKVPVISALSQHFTLFDEWFSSVPGPTFANRMFFHAASSNGECYNWFPPGGFEMRTVYELLDAAGYDWAMYIDDLSDSNMFAYTRQPKYADRIRSYNLDFARDAQAQRLPTYSFIMPRMIANATSFSNDQHPDHSIALGEQLIKDIYESLRNSPSWESSALLITYDEHGGFYDHVPTPTEGVPNPDGKMCTKPTDFDYKRLGVRVPTIVASPWADARVVSRNTFPEARPTPTSQYDHTSLINTMTKMFGLEANLTARSAWATPFDNIFSRTSPRTDCPSKLPEVHQPSLKAYLEYRKKFPEFLQKPNELQISYLRAANDLLGLDREENLQFLATEQDASDYAHKLNKIWRDRL